MGSAAEVILLTSLTILRCIKGRQTVCLPAFLYIENSHIRNVAKVNGEFEPVKMMVFLLLSSQNLHKFCRSSKKSVVHQRVIEFRGKAVYYDYKHCRKSVGGKGKT